MSNIGMPLKDRRVNIGLNNIKLSNKQEERLKSIIGNQPIISQRHNQWTTDCASGSGPLIIYIALLIRLIESQVEILELMAKKKLASVLIVALKFKFELVYKIFLTEFY